MFKNPYSISLKGGTAHGQKKMILILNIPILKHAIMKKVSACQHHLKI